MVLLWRDPEGNTVSVSAGNNSIPAQNSCSEQMMITTLQSSIGEKDHLIAKLKNEINALKEVSVFFIYCYVDSYSFVLHSFRKIQPAISVQSIKGQALVINYLCEQ